MNIGEIIRNTNGGMTGYVAEATYDFGNLFFELVESDHERAPKFNLMTKSPRGRVVRLGSIWERTANETGEFYFRGYIDSSVSGYVPIRLHQSRQKPHVWNIIRNTPNRRREATGTVELTPPPARKRKPKAEPESMAA
jgi:uncharacterized protein (DUF736 family)